MVILSCYFNYNRKQYGYSCCLFYPGIWGSAFCILFKRLLDDNRKLDPVEMIRQEMGKFKIYNYIR